MAERVEGCRCLFFEESCYAGERAEATPELADKEQLRTTLVHQMPMRGKAQHYVGDPEARRAGKNDSAKDDIPRGTDEKQISAM